MNVLIMSDKISMRHFSYFWLKTVKGFWPSSHCAGCLRGEYFKDFNRDMPVNKKIEIACDQGGVVYACGVWSKRDWSKNFHLPMIVDGISVSQKKLACGSTIIFEGAKEIFFDDKKAIGLFPDKTKNFLTCRNFQFACHYFMKEK